MKARAILLGLALCFAGAAACFAADAFTGTWKLNEAKSKLAPGLPKNTTVVYQATGDDVKVTIDGTDSAGNPVHNEWTGKLERLPGNWGSQFRRAAPQKNQRGRESGETNREYRLKRRTKCSMHGRRSDLAAMSRWPRRTRFLTIS